MIVDTSVVIAVLKEESDGPRFLRALTMSTQPKRISAANYLEAAIEVDANRNPLLSRRIDDLIVQTEIEVEAVTPQQADITRAAYRDFGRGSGHPAQLNFGDCFA
jgi:ribonuclease VapC